MRYFKFHLAFALFCGTVAFICFFYHRYDLGLFNVGLFGLNIIIGIIREGLEE